MSGILPTRFDPTTRWEDTSASKWNAWLEATKTNTAKVQTLWELVRKLMRRRLTAGAVPSVSDRRVIIAAISTGDTLEVKRAELRDGQVWGTGDPFTVAKFRDVQRTPFDGKAPGDGYTYQYATSGLSRVSVNVNNEADRETQEVRPIYYVGEVIRITRIETFVEDVGWEETSARHWGKVLE